MSRIGKSLSEWKPDLTCRVIRAKDRLDLIQLHKAGGSNGLLKFFKLRGGGHILSPFLRTSKIATGLRATEKDFHVRSISVECCCKLRGTESFLNAKWYGARGQKTRLAHRTKRHGCAPNLSRGTATPPRAQKQNDYLGTNQRRCPEFRGARRFL